MKFTRVPIFLAIIHASFDKTDGQRFVAFLSPSEDSPDDIISGGGRFPLLSPSEDSPNDMISDDERFPLLSSSEDSPDDMISDGERFPSLSPSEDSPNDMISDGAGAEQRCQRGNYKLPRISIEFTRFEDYDGPVSIWETLPDYTEDPDLVNCHLSIINAMIKPVNYRDPDVISDEKVLEDMLSGNPDFDAIVNELYEPRVRKFMRDVVYEAGRTPMFSLDQTVLNTTLISLGDPFFTPGTRIGDTLAPLPMVIPYGLLDSATLTNLTNEFAHIHANFWQGLDMETGYVDHTLYPTGPENRFFFLPPYHEDDVPVYMFFYVGEGVVAKIRMWVGSDSGWELSYLGMWPHAFVPNSNYNVFFQAAGGAAAWIAWYNLEDPSAQRTVDIFVARNEAQVSPDYDFVLGKNPWVRFEEISVENNGIEGVVIGE